MLRFHSILCLLVVFLFLPIAVHAQKITGQIQDSKTLEALPFANVFINNSTMGAVTNTNGEFELIVKEPGLYEVIFSFVGYESYRRKITVGDQMVALGVIKLVPDEKQLSSVEVVSKRDKEWDKKLKKFKKIFFGEGKQGSACVLANPWVLEFSNSSTGRFVATASAPLEFTNDALGYKVIFYLKNFWSDANGYAIAGDTRFTPLTSNNAKQIEKWELNRTTAYLHSSHHLFKSILQKQMRGEGFTLYSQIIGAENPSIRSSVFYSEIGKKVSVYDTIGIVRPDAQKGYYRITLKGHLEVHYDKIRSEVPFYADFTGPVSWLDVSRGYVVVNENGHLKNPTDVVVSGAMSANRVAQMLPTDYSPGQKSMQELAIQMQYYQEQVYVHTDKSYYYPGETIWCRGYLNYHLPAWRDSLSQTVYVELIDRATRRFIQSKTVRIDSGFFTTDFALPDTLPAATYHIRAYTKLNRMFGDRTLYTKPVPVLDLKDRVKPEQIELPTTVTEVRGETQLSVQTASKTYKPREEIKLDFSLRDDEDKPLAATVSVAVTDALQVIPVQPTHTIITDYPLRELDMSKVAKADRFEIEHGVHFTGRCLAPDLSTPIQTMLNVLQLDRPNFTMAQSDRQGNFAVNGMVFYDTASFYIHTPTKQKIGKIELIERKPAPIDFDPMPITFNTTKSELPQRITPQSALLQGTTVLNEVEVKAKKIVDQTIDRVKRPYGRVDYVLKRKDLNLMYGNLLQTLPGKVPGLVVRQADNPGGMVNGVMSNGNGLEWVVYIAKGGNSSSILNPKEVLITINDVVITGKPDQILSSINPQTVESIEVKTGVNVLYGSLGGNGVISIYTRKDISDDLVKTSKGVSSTKIMGYYTPQKFHHPDYANPETDKTRDDYRATVYWNPEVRIPAKTGTASVSFFAAALPGKYHVVVEGVAKNGQPIRCVYEFEVKEEN